MTFASFSTAIIEFAIGNLALAMPLGLLAWWLQRRGRQPFLAHLLWLVVLIKLVTPPLYAFRIFPTSETIAGGTTMPVLPFSGEIIGPVTDPSWLSTFDWQVAAAGLWLAGSAIVLAWTLLRAYRFNRLLRATSKPAADAYQQVALRVAKTLDLKRSAVIYVTAANVSPMVWWVGGAVRIYVPQSMVDQMDHTELCAILAHELGHIKRGDHYVRWLECFVCVALWWNPVAWWARRNLRACEEICCDAFVLSRTEASRDAYAGALVSAMELLATPTISPAALASHVNGGFIERRIKMILSGEKVLQTPRWLRGLVIAAAVVLLPLGFTLAQDSEDDLEMARQWLESGVNSAFLTQDQADVMMRALEASQYNYGVTFIGEEGHVINLQSSGDVPGENVRVIAERISADVANGGNMTAVAVPIQLGTEIEGSRLVRIESVAVNQNGEPVSNVRVVREFDGDVLITENFQPVDVEVEVEVISTRVVE